MVGVNSKFAKYTKGEQQMQELEKKMQNENFDVKVQYCNPDDCYLDCQDAANHCNYHFTTMF